METINQIFVNNTLYDIEVDAANIVGDITKATEADKLSVSAGSITQPIYFYNGVPKKTKYTLEKSVPSNADFNNTTYSEVTTSISGLMSAEDKIKLDSISENANNYTLPYATDTRLGGIKVGTGIINSSGTISVSYGKAAGTACIGNDSRLSDTRTPKSHAASSTTYGGGTSSNYGHVKLSDSISDSAASSSIAATPKAVKTALEDRLSNYSIKVLTQAEYDALTPNNSTIYFITE